MGLLTRKDALNRRGYFNEMVRFIGQSVGYQYVLSEDWTIHSEANAKFSAPIRINIIFDENPSIDTLNKIGWISELNEETPIIANFPYNTPNLTVNARVMIGTIDGIDRPRLFEVTKLKSDLEYPDCITCALVPVFDQFAQRNQYTLVNNEKLSEEESNRTAENQATDFLTGNAEINTVPQQNVDYENTYIFINDDDSPYSG